MICREGIQPGMLSRVALEKKFGRSAPIPNRHTAATTMARNEGMRNIGGWTYFLPSSLPKKPPTDAPAARLSLPDAGTGTGLVSRSATVCRTILT